MTQNTSKHPLRFLLFTAAVAVAALSACDHGSAETARRAALITAPKLQGNIRGGQQPVGGVTLQLYQAGTTGYGSAATPLGVAVMTTAKGNFTLPSYTCAPGSQVYLVGTGGQPTPGVTNSSLAVMAGLGTCGGAGLSSFIDANELTTVATVWALAPFMAGIANVGSDPANATGLANAFAAINELVATTNGTVSGPALPAGATLPVAEIDVLADLLAQCVNSGGGVAGDSSACGNLFALAPDSSGTIYPTNTIVAALNIARNPGRNVAALYSLLAGNPPFTPVYSTGTQPNDWTIAITYSGGGLSTPTAIATDAAGSVWVTNGGNSSVTKLDDTGTAISGGSGFTIGGFSGPSAIAIDASGNAWVANAGNNTITVLNPAGTAGSVYSGNGLSTPRSIAIDGSGDVWVANSGSNAVSAFTSSGAVLSGSPFSGASASGPVSVAITPK